MDPSKLWIVTVSSNPMGTEVRPKLTNGFVKHAAKGGANVILVECALRDRPFVHENICAAFGANWRPVRHQTICWHKESALNLALATLPPEAEYVAWIDGDLEFQTPDFASKIVAALQQFPIIQPWEHCWDLGPQGQFIQTHTSLAALWRKKKPILTNHKPGYTAAHPGYAWAARRETLEALGGLFDLAILGAADRNMAMALLGRVNETFYKDITPELKNALLSWQDKALTACGGRLGVLPGMVLKHFWHGQKAKRGYLSRPEILRRHKYNPVSDTKYNLHRIIEVVGKPALLHDIELYFMSRDEDSNSLG
jgi:hypothetical protein